MMVGEATTDAGSRSQPVDVDAAGDGFNYDPSYSYDQDQKPGLGKDQDGENGYADGEAEGEAEDPLEPADYWTIISAFLDGKGLVRQQLDSFNEFVENTIQEIVDENSRLTLDQYTQYTGAEGDETVCLSLSPSHSHVSFFSLGHSHSRCSCSCSR